MRKQEGFSLRAGISFHGTHLVLAHTILQALAHQAQAICKQSTRFLLLCSNASQASTCLQFLWPKTSNANPGIQVPSVWGGDGGGVFNNNQLWVVFLCLLDPESFKHNQITLSNYTGRCVAGWSSHKHKD